MKLHLNNADNTNLIAAVDKGAIRIGQEVYEKSVIVTSDRIERWPPQSVAELTEIHFEALSLIEPEVVILGTGLRLRFPAAHLSRPLMARGIGLEIMDTGAACRTYNILAGDGRRVLAALLLES